MTILASNKINMDKIKRCSCLATQHFSSYYKRSEKKGIGNAFR